MLNPYSKILAHIRNRFIHTGNFHGDGESAYLNHCIAIWRYSLGCEGHSCHFITHLSRLLLMLGNSINPPEHFTVIGKRNCIGIIKGQYLSVISIDNCTNHFVV